MKKVHTISSEFDRLRSFQNNLYSAIELRQRQLDQQLKARVKKYNCEIERETLIKERNSIEQIKHPNNNGVYMYLGNCIQELELTDLQAIKARQEERQKEKERMAEMKRLESKGMEIHNPNQEEEELQEHRKDVRKEKKKQVPWKLMRKLREQDVLDNKKRIQKKLQDKIEKIKSKFD